MSMREKRVSYVTKKTIHCAVDLLSSADGRSKRSKRMKVKVLGSEAGD